MIQHALLFFFYFCPQFNPVVALNEKNQNYIKDPSPNDKVHCLVSVVPADSISLMSKEVIDKMTSVRKIALDLGKLLEDIIFI